MKIELVVACISSLSVVAAGSTACSLEGLSGGSPSLDAGAGTPDGARDAQSDGGDASIGPQLSRCDAPGLLAYFRFDEGAGTITKDCSPVGAEGQLVGANVLFTSDGRVGSAISFSGGPGAFVDLGPAPHLRRSDSLTVSAWIRPGASDGTTGYVMANTNSFDRGWGLRVGSAASGADLRLAFEIGVASDSVDTIEAAAPLVADRWAHVAGTYDSVSKTMSVYIDGIEKGTKATAAARATRQTTRIGRSDDCCSFRGTIDEVRVFDRALAAAELSALADVP